MEGGVKEPKKIDFNRDIRPILSDNCFYCHGPDPNHREGKLRFDQKEGLFGVHDDTYPVVPGKLDDSQLWLRITSDDDEDKMPPKKTNKHLKPEQIALFKRWIEEGAEWKPHWAYVPPVRPAVPNVAADPALKGGAWPRNSIDNFVLAELDEQGLKPSAEADRRTLIRRLSLDLVGLPPTAEEVDEFVNDKEPNAYEKLVNRLMASPHYGERMTEFWMDLVRYGDTIGFHSDNPREVWPWRDWCINAFNTNQPFDQMTIDQIAGDLEPNATREQKVASAYNRLLLTTGEGGAQAKEYIAKYAGDRVRNVSTTWMGATMGCCQCHDHKFDPYTQKDFYSMAAFFADIQEPAISLPQPELLLPNAEQQEELDRLDKALADANAKLKVTTPEIAASQAEFEKKYVAQKDTTKWERVTFTSAQSKGGAKLTIAKDKQAILARGPNPPTDVYTVKATTKLKGITAIRIEAVPHGELPLKGPGRSGNGNFVLTEFEAGISKGAGPSTRPVAFNGASATSEQVAQSPDETPYGRWPAIAAIDGDRLGANWGWAILPRVGQITSAVFETATDIGDGNEIEFTFTLKQNFGDGANLGHFRIYVTNSPRPVRAVPDSNVPTDIAKILDVEPAKRTAEQKDAVAAFYRTIAPQLEPVRMEIAKLNAERAELTGPAEVSTYAGVKHGRIARTLISVSGTPRVTRILHRGNWQDETGEIVAPAVPAFLEKVAPVSHDPVAQTPHAPGEPDKQPRLTRLDLAHWLIARDNPLTARVFVNRLWKLFYGRGIANPLDDVGVQSDWPSHPELLDWLAVEFMDSGWDVKHMVRLMVSSATYRQSSASPKELREKDPFDKYLERQMAFRLDAEFVRDNALAISGLLSPRMFGPSVKPYQPPGYWDFLNFPKRTYESDHGEKLYRRGLYTWWQRTFLNPELLNFDAPSHEECVAERARSNTPQQALTLLNDPTYVEAARVFAEKIMKSGGKDATGRVKWAFEHSLFREPDSRETPVLLSLLDNQTKRYANDKPSAEKITSVGEAPVAKDVDVCELAAWTSVARTILNLHETITRD